MKRKFTFLIAAAVMLLTMVATTGRMWGQTTVTQTSFTAISGNVNNDTKVSYAAYKGGGTSNPAVNSNAIRLYQNSSGDTGGYVVIGVSEGYVITSATIQSTMATTTGYKLTDSDPGSTTPAKNTFNVSNYSLSANTDYTVGDISTRFIVFACFGTSSSSRLYLSKISITYQSTGGGSDPEIVIPDDELSLSYEENIDGSFTVSYNDFEPVLATATLFTDAGCTQAFPTTGDDAWIVLDDMEAPYTSISYIVDQNNGTERTAYMKVEAWDDEYNDLDGIFTITQAAQQTYTVTYNANGGTGTMTDPNSPYHANDNVTLLANTFTAPDGKVWDSWLVKDVQDETVTVNEGHFTMPASNVTVTAQWIDDPSGPTYEWVLTDLADLTAEDVFVIVGNNGDTYAMSNDKGTGAAPDAIAVTIEYDKITTGIVDKIKWNISGNASDGYTFYPNGDTGTWLYCTNSNNGVRVGTNNSKTFVVDDDYLKHVGTSRYVGIYNSQDWRCYTSNDGNIAGQTFAFYKRQEATNDPTISASNVEITYDATEGSIAYTINNPIVGGILSASTTAIWLTPGEVTNSAVPFTCTANEVSLERTATVTLTYTYNTNQTVTKDVTVTQAAAPVIYTTIPEIFAAATGSGTNVNVTFGNWVVSGVSGSTAYVTDNIGNGFIIYKSGHGFAVNDKLSGTVTGTPLKLYSGSAEFTNLTTSTTGLSVSDDGEITVITNKTIEELSGVNTGAVITLNGLTYDGTNLSDGVNNIKPYNTLYNGMTFIDGKTYNVTGVYVQYNNTKEILPRSTADIEEVIIITPVINAENVELAYNATSGEITYSITNPTQSVNLGATTTADWVSNIAVTADKVTFTTTANEGNEDRIATFTLTYTGAEDKIVTVTQRYYVNPGDKYVLFNGELVEGDYLIVYDGAAMNNTVTSDRLQYKDVTINDNVIATDDAAIIWHIAPSGNYWTIYSANAEAYAASTGVKNKAQLLADGTDDKALWTITGTDTYDFVNKKNTEAEVNAYLRKNGTYGFACYASGTGGALSLYKKNYVLPVTGDDLTASVTIPDGDASVYDNLTIPAGEDYVLTVSGILEVTGTFTNTVAEHLIIEDGGQLIYNGSVQATMKKSTAHSAKTAADWYTIASPLNETVTTTSGNTNLTTGLDTDEYDLYRYNETSMKWENSKAGANSTNFTNIEAGRGYLYWREDGADLVFAGELRNNDVNYTLTAGAENDDLKGFNLIGNPFSQNITMSNITGATLTGGYVLTQAGAWGASVETTIAPCQGFLVQVDAAKTITISKSAAKSRANRNYIAFTVANSQYEDVTYAMFEEGLGLNKINHRNDNIPMLYIAQNEENYAIATMSDETQSFNLNFKAMTTGQYTLSYKAEGNYDYLHVIDRLTGEDIDMLLDGEYSFIASPSDNDARFIVRLGYNANGNVENDIFAYQNGSDIIVNGEGELQVFDVTGRMVMNQHVNGVQTVNMPSNGVYIFKLNEKTQKIVVR